MADMWEHLAQRMNETTSGRQRIAQRLQTCNCGCRGRDSWHALTTTRVVRNVQRHFIPIVVLDHGDGYRQFEVASATYQHPSGPRVCKLYAVQSAFGRPPYVLGWEWEDYR